MLNVVFPQLVLVEENDNVCDGCYDCYFEDDCDVGLIEKLTGIDCVSMNVIFKKKKEWVTCTKENTKVGDKVKSTVNLKIAEIKFIYSSGFDCFKDCIVNYIDDDGPYSEIDISSMLQNFEIEIVR